MLETRRLTDWIVHRQGAAVRVPADTGEVRQPDPSRQSGGSTRRSSGDDLPKELRTRKNRQPPYLDLWLP